jgi:homoserine O-succinyltransferase/O-acetyltransferase
MPLFLDTARNALAFGSGAADCVTVGLVNNMPDAAIDATERQFTDLLRAASGKAVVRLKLYALPDVPRSAEARAALAERYRDIAELLDTRLDGLVVTGTEPRAPSLKDEPYWGTLTRLIDWAGECTGSTIWSCLAAHAAVLHADGIERIALPQKLFGVFDSDVVAAHQLTSGVKRLRIPHSRYNDLSQRALSSCGYQILSRSVSAGVDVFAKQGKSFFLFLQGHPEYEADTLLREYRRDAGRFLRGEREHYPAIPEGYFSIEAKAVANAFHEHALLARSEDLAADFPMEALEIGLESTWRPSAVGLYANWIAYLSARRLKASSLRAAAGQPSRRNRPLAGVVRKTADGTVH